MSLEAIEELTTLHRAEDHQPKLAPSEPAPHLWANEPVAPASAYEASHGTSRLSANAMPLPPPEGRCMVARHTALLLLRVMSTHSSNSPRVATNPLSGCAAPVGQCSLPAMNAVHLVCSLLCHDDLIYTQQCLSQARKHLQGRKCCRPRPDNVLPGAA